MSARSLLAIALLASLCMRALWLSSVAPFEAFVVAKGAPRFSATAIDVQMGEHGAVRIRAAKCEPGHKAVGPMWFGIPTHVALTDVEATVQGADGRRETYTSREAQWDGKTLEMRGPVRMWLHGKERTVNGVRITDQGAELMR